jgi:hypothetical protein
MGAGAHPTPRMTIEAGPDGRAAFGGVPSDEDTYSRVLAMVEPVGAAVGGALLLSLSASIPNWPDLWRPWSEALAGAKRTPLFEGDWASIIDLGQHLRTGAANSTGIRGLLNRRPVPRFGPATNDIEALLQGLAGSDSPQWQRLEKFASKFWAAMQSVEEPPCCELSRKLRTLKVRRRGTLAQCRCSPMLGVWTTRTMRGSSVWTQVC